MNAIEKGNQRIKSILGVFLKTGKKRLLISTLVSIIIFTLLLTFLLTWFNYRYTSFQNYEEAHDWYNNNEISVIYDSGFKDGMINVSSYLDLAVDEIYSTVDGIASDMFDNYTASMYYRMESVNYNLENQTYDTSLMTFQQEVFEILTNNLIEGRIPNNKSELIYYSSDLSSPVYQLGDQLGLYATEGETFHLQNFTIVGIVDSVENKLYKHGFSRDIFRSFRKDQREIDQFKMDLFFTSSQYFINIISNYPYDYSQRLTLNVDFSCQIRVKEIRSLFKITDELNNIQFSSQYYSYLPQRYSVFCSDFEIFIVTFQSNWLSQTINLFLIGVPLFLLFGLIIIELFNIGNFEKRTQFKIIKNYGLDFSTLRKILLVENLIPASFGLVIGSSLGILIGYLVSSFGLDITNSVSYFNALLEPVVPITFLSLFTFLFMGGFILETRLARRTLQLTSEIYKTKRKKYIRKILSSTESLLLLSGIITSVIGFLSWLYISNSDYSLTLAVVSLLSVFVFLMVVGVTLTLASLFLLLSKMIIFLWRYIGKQVWKRRRSYFTLALKQLSIYSKDYKRVIFIALLVSLCVSPGLVLSKSKNDHLEMEANLKAGFSDILIQSWVVNNTRLMENVSSIDGVELVAQVDVVELGETSNVKASNTDDRAFDVDILSIYNVSKFIDAISDNFPNSCEYTLTDIYELEKNMTYMMSSKYAQKENYDKDRVYTSSKITSLSYDSYNMIFIDKFDYFPILPYKSTNFLDRLFLGSLLHEEKYNLVMSNLTYSQLDLGTEIYTESYLLVKTTSAMNKDQIIDEIEKLPYIISVTSPEDELNFLELEFNQFSIGFLVIITIISFLLFFFEGYITARDIYKQRIRITESEYIVGAKKHQIWLNFSIELLLVTIFPLLISILLSSILLYNAHAYFLGIPQNFKKFVPWLPVWFIVLILLFSLLVVLSGWSFEMWNQFRRYKSVRQE